MARTAEQLERDYTDSIERANRWEDTDPERHRNLLRDAEQARATGYRELAEAATSEANAARMENLRTAAKAKYPLADPNAIRGDTPEALDASAKASHDHVEAAVKAQQEADRGARRAESRAAWTGTTTGTRVGLPGAELTQQVPVAREAAEAAYRRTAEVIANARLPGPLRQYSPDNTQAVPPSGDPEQKAWDDYKTLHPNSGLRLEAFRARATGEGTFTEPENTGVSKSEDAKG